MFINGADKAEVRGAGDRRAGWGVVLQVVESGRDCDKFWEEDQGGD
jgi:hypothetical protein